VNRPKTAGIAADGARKSGSGAVCFIFCEDFSPLIAGFSIEEWQRRAKKAASPIEKAESREAMQRMTTQQIAIQQIAMHQEA
jgi:hypothetical protein